MEQVLRQTYAFFFRDYHLTRRYFSWVVVFTFYAVVNSATVVLIGVAGGGRRVLPAGPCLLLGVLFPFLGVVHPGAVFFVGGAAGGPPPDADADGGRDAVG